MHYYGRNLDHSRRPCQTQDHVNQIALHTAESIAQWAGLYNPGVHAVFSCAGGASACTPGRCSGAATAGAIEPTAQLLYALVVIESALCPALHTVWNQPSLPSLRSYVWLPKKSRCAWTRLAGSFSRLNWSKYPSDALIPGVAMPAAIACASREHCRNDQRHWNQRINTLRELAEPPTITEGLRKPGLATILSAPTIARGNEALLAHNNQNVPSEADLQPVRVFYSMSWGLQAEQEIL